MANCYTNVVHIPLNLSILPEVEVLFCLMLLVQIIIRLCLMALNGVDEVYTILASPLRRLEYSVLISLSNLSAICLTASWVPRIPQGNGAPGRVALSTITQALF